MLHYIYPTLGILAPSLLLLYLYLFSSQKAALKKPMVVASIGLLVNCLTYGLHIYYENYAGSVKILSIFAIFYFLYIIFDLVFPIILTSFPRIGEKTEVLQFLEQTHLKSLGIPILVLLGLYLISILLNQFAGM